MALSGFRGDDDRAQMFAMVVLELLYDDDRTILRFVFGRPRFWRCGGEERSFFYILWAERG
jgi:hypothetical protein